MKSVLIVGAGRFGRHMAQKLNQLGHQVMIVDGDEERVRVALPYATRGQKRLFQEPHAGFMPNFCCETVRMKSFIPKKNLPNGPQSDIFLIIFLITSNLMTRIRFLRLTFLKLGCTKRCPI